MYSESGDSSTWPEMATTMTKGLESGDDRVVGDAALVDRRVLLIDGSAATLYQVSSVYPEIFMQASTRSTCSRAVLSDEERGCLPYDRPLTNQKVTLQKISLAKFSLAGVRKDSACLRSIHSPPMTCQDAGNFEYMISHFARCYQNKGFILCDLRRTAFAVTVKVSADLYFLSLLDKILVPSSAKSNKAINSIAMTSAYMTVLTANNCCPQSKFIHSSYTDILNLRPHILLVLITTPHHLYNLFPLLNAHTSLLADNLP